MRSVARILRALSKSAKARAWVVIAALGVCVARDSHAQLSYLIGGSLGYNYGNGPITAFDNGGIRCGVFDSTRGSGFNFFVGTSYRLSADWSIDSKIGYRNLSSSVDIVPDGGNPPLVYLGPNQYVPAVRHRTYQTNLRLLDLSADINYELIRGLRISSGLFAGHFLSPTFTETERLDKIGDKQPVYTENNKSSREIRGGPINNIRSIPFGLELGGSFEIPIQSRVSLRPSAEYVIPFQSIPDQNGLLRLTALTGSISFVYHPPTATTQPPQFAWDSLLTVPTPPIAQKEEKKRSVLSVSIKAVGVDQNGEETGEPVLSIERVHVTEVYPMLHYVFFDDGSAEIPARYHTHTASTKSNFDEKALYTANALEIHHNVLDILGKRLSEAPHTSITIVGSRSEHSPADSADGISISSARAQSVRNYLISVWGINANRLHIKARDLPDVASDDHNPFGEAENRRVEILPSSPDITAPLWTERIERIASPPRINFDPQITTNAGIRSASILVKQGDRILRSFDVLKDSVTADYGWTLDDRSMPDRRDSLTYVFTVVDSLGETAQATGTIHLRQELHDVTKHEADTALDKELEKYSLILFDYSSSQLDKKESDRIVHDMAQAVKNSSDVVLTGHTDKTGDESYNDKLARDRVNRAADMLNAALRHMGKEKPDMKVMSRGSRDNLFDNSIPEGRVLSRTVRALIESDTK